MMTEQIQIRHAQPDDCDQLLKMMQELAIFEDYINDFKVTKADLLHHGFSCANNEIPNFTAIIAEQGTHLQGYLVYYLIPFTYDLRPTLFIKELYVDKSTRGKGMGRALMEQAILDAKNKQCGRLKWDVLSDNIAAQSFYKSLGAYYDKRWQGFVLHVDN